MTECPDFLFPASTQLLVRNIAKLTAASFVIGHTVQLNANTILAPPERPQYNSDNAIFRQTTNITEQSRVYCGTIDVTVLICVQTTCNDTKSHHLASGKRVTLMSNTVLSITSACRDSYSFKALYVTW